MTTRLLITGAAGFLGGHVAAAARQQPDLRVRLLRHRTPPATGPEQEVVDGALDDAGSLRSACAGVDVVIHCASLVGGPAGASSTINDHGTRDLVGAATVAGARVVYLSTASVYGRGPFTALRPGGAPAVPVGATSSSRAAAERHVLAAGGTVLRPHLVYGRGDRWMVPGLVRLLRTLGAQLTDCPARHSLIDAADLGRIAVAAATTPGISGVQHVDHGDPVATTVLVSTVDDHLGLGLHRRMDVAAARRAVAGDPVAEHHLALLTADHWFVDEDLTARGIAGSGGGFAELFSRHAGWYRDRLTALR